MQGAGTLRVSGSVFRDNTCSNGGAIGLSHFDSFHMAYLY